MAEEEIVKEVKEQLRKVDLVLILNQDSHKQLRSSLVSTINNLVTNNFSLLISILYRLDIPEKKLRLSLSEAGPQTTGEIIAKMIIERQIQKIEARKLYTNTIHIPEEDKW